MAQPSEPGTIIQTLPAGAGVPDSTTNDCPGWLTSDGSRRAFLLLKQRKDTGIIDPEGVTRHPAPDTCDLKYPEGTYDKPDNHVLVSRSILYVDFKKKDDVTAINRRTADQELCDLGQKAVITNSHIDDQVLLMEDVRTEFAVGIKSASEIYFAKKVKEAELPKGPNKPEHCNTAADAWKAYKVSDVTSELCKKMWSIFFCLDDGIIHGMVYAVMMTMGLWYLTHGKDETSNQTYFRSWVNSTKLKVSCFTSLAKSKIRDFLNNQTKESRLSHGVKITNSIVGGRKAAGLARRLKKEFFKLGQNTCDFGGPLHVDYNERNGFLAPLPFLPTEFVNRVRRFVTCFAVLPHSHFSPPFADPDSEWNEEGEAKEANETGEC